MKLVVKLCGNPDKGETQAPCPGMSVKVTNFAEASKKLRAFIEKTGIGGGNLDKANIINDAGNKVLARVSYNGKVWGGLRYTEVLYDPALFAQGDERITYYIVAVTAGRGGEQVTRFTREGPDKPTKKLAKDFAFGELEGDPDEVKLTKTGGRLIQEEVSIGFGQTKEEAMEQFLIARFDVDTAW